MRGILGWVNELPPVGKPGEQCLEESVDPYQQARGMCVQQRGHDGPHRTDAMRAEARGEKSVPRYQPTRSASAQLRKVIAMVEEIQRRG